MDCQRTLEGEPDEYISGSISSISTTSIRGFTPSGPTSDPKQITEPNPDAQLTRSLATAAHHCHFRKVNYQNDQRQGAEDRRNDPNVSVMEAWDSTRPMPKDW